MLQSLAFVPLFLAAQILGQAVVEESLLKQLIGGQSKDIMVSFGNGNSEIINQIKGQSFPNDVARREAMVSALETAQINSQSGVMGMLNQQGVKYESFWVSNQISIKKAPAALVNMLQSAPGVSGIREEEKIPISSPIVEIESNMTRQSGNNEWGCETIQCDYAWHYNKGRGAIIGSIDTGALGSHEALRSNFRGTNENGWYDPFDKAANPVDENGHGTHTIGTMCGAKVGSRRGIGVAPEARWIACRGCKGSSCDGSALLACAQFMVCPHNTNGDRNTRDCSKTPGVVNNSWGGGTRGSWYDDSIRAWIEANIVPVFSNGNSGQNCETAGYPGNHKDVIGVGATDSGEGLARFSSRGRSANGNGIKPDVSAPGVSIMSAHSRGNSEYASMSGTSMAAPHVAGVVALIKSEKPNSRVNQIVPVINWAVETDKLKKTGQNCGGVSDDDYPNNSFGHGRINAYYAAWYARNHM